MNRYFLENFFSKSSYQLDIKVIFWLSLSLIFAVVYSFFGLREAFRSEWVIQDDARQHIVWMLRL